jgi:hypothetical protein
MVWLALERKVELPALSADRTYQVLLPRKEKPAVAASAQSQSATMRSHTAAK